MSKEYPTIQQHEPLRTPSDWSSQGKRFIAQLEEILDDIYRRFNRIRLKDLNPSLQETIVASEEGVASLTVDVGGIKTEVHDARGSYSSLKQRADSIETEVHDARGSYSTLKQRADSIETEVHDARGNSSSLKQRVDSIESSVSDAEGNISTLQQTATNLTSRVGTAEGNISTIQQQANSIELTVGKLNINGSNLILGGDKEYSGTSYNLAEWPYFQELIPGETYTFTVCMTPAPQADVPNYRLFTSAGLGSVGRLYPSGTNKQILSLTFKFMDAGYTGTNHVLRLYRGENVTTTASTTIHWAKLEKGKQTSDAYTPPPNGSDNMLYDSGVKISASDSSTRYFGNWKADEMVVGETYTFTACIKPGSDHTSFQLYTCSGSAVTLVNVISYISDTGKQVVSGTFVFTGYTNTDHRIRCFRRPTTVTTAGTLYWAKLTKGVNREAWSPNPNEVDNTSILLNNEGIKLRTGGTIDMQAGSELNVQSGGELNVESSGAMNIGSGGELNIQSGGALNVTGSDVNINAGGTLTMNGGTLNLSGSAGGSLLLSSGDVTAENGNFDAISLNNKAMTMGSRKNGSATITGAFLLPVKCWFTVDASTKPSTERGYLWFNSTSVTQTSSTVEAPTSGQSVSSDGRTMTSNTITDTLSNPTSSNPINYTLTFTLAQYGFTQAQSNTLSAVVSNGTNSVTFAGQTKSMAQWASVQFSLTASATTSSKNLFSTATTLSITLTSTNPTDGAHSVCYFTGVPIVLTAQSSATSGEGTVTVKYIS